MSGYNLLLVPSRYARYGLLALALLPLFIVAALPLPPLWFAALVPCLMLYYLHCYKRFLQLNAAVAVVITAQGELHWHGEALASGRLYGGLVSQYAILLRWQQMGSKQRHQRWVFADQCDDDSFRALARAVQQLSWQAPSNMNVDDKS